MRLNPKNYPSYYDLFKNFEYVKYDSVINRDLDFSNRENFYNFFNSLKSSRNQVSKKYYITETFRESINKAIPKIVKDENYFEEPKPGCGILLNDRGFTLYLVPSDKKIKLLCFGFTRDVLTTYGVMNNDGSFSGVSSTILNGELHNDTNHLGMYLHGILCSLYFINNCEVEQKIVKPNEKYRENGNKHFNESDSDIIFLDCRWFTELIKNTPFNVKGHLRWQVCGEKFSKRKLIWIDEFQKTGYHRDARKNQYA